MRDKFNLQNLRYFSVNIYQDINIQFQSFRHYQKYMSDTNDCIKFVPERRFISTNPVFGLMFNATNHHTHHYAIGN
jgi:hypothetical protein